MKAVSRNLNLNVRRAKRSATLAINERSAELQSLGRKIYRLGLGQSPFPVPDFVQEELRKHAHQKDYLPVAGLLPLREAVAEFHNRRDGLQAGPEDVMIGPGSKELLFMAQLCYSGELLLPAPSWVSYQPQASLLGLPTCWINTSVEDGWRLKPEDLKEACQNDPTRPRLLILNYPNNPAGTTLGEERLRELARVCREFGLLVLSDEIYGEVNHAGSHVSLATFYPEGTIISNGLSKWCGAGGWRLGTFLFPKNLYWLREAMSVVASETYTSVSAPVQWAAVAAFQADERLQHYLRRSRKVLGQVAQTSHQILLEAGLQVPKPEGGFYLFPDASALAPGLAARGVTTSPELCEQLLNDTGVAVLPGSDFGRPDSELTFRMATVNFDGASALNEVDSFSGSSRSFVENHCPELFEALNRIAQWVHS
ncbi:MAG: aminotransferase class I/II-fold pyridoxal phosphate-dependent enzyme [Vulcanimicrobiota bacterium]